MNRAETCRPRSSLKSDSCHPSVQLSIAERLDRVRLGYEITNRRDYTVERRPEEPAKNVPELREYTFTTLEQGEWHLQIPIPLTSKSWLSEENLYLNGLSEDLNSRQTLAMFLKITKRSSTNPKAIHDRASHFFMQNWQMIAGLFYDPPALRTGPYPAFAEVDFSMMEEQDQQRERQRKGCGFADFIGVANHYFVIDFGSKTKEVNPGQLRRQVRALQTLSVANSDPIPGENIIALGCVYDFSNQDYARLTILIPPEKDILRPTSIIFSAGQPTSSPAGNEI